MEELSGESTAKTTRHDYVSAFITEFRDKKQCLEETLEEVENIDDNTIVGNKINDMLVEFEYLKKLLGNSIHYLPSYNVKVSQESLNSILRRIDAKRSETAPKKKFGFNRKQVSRKESEDKSKSVVDACIVPSQLHLKDIPFVGFQRETKSKLALNSVDVFKKDVNLSSLENCDVNIFGTPSTVHMEDIRNCRINIGPVQTSIFVSDCSDTVFNLACQQLRIHTTTNSRFNVHVTSRCIIEDCKNVTFAEWNKGNWSYDAIDDDFRKANLDVKTNNWNKVCDFNWLVADKPSPNWSIAND
ncbi:tubulin-specific chaperone C-like protein [Leptotrombidium deliense]|uniref:Tubulin-specific chaperone C-like protein n=1 Tax=Leptotrombidium deliense TaxID=299467 RepID=A0A443SQ10_9ACAR|nr:tubulin-specific chaperone C-like protein [Leptotrombidium deliense]